MKAVAQALAKTGTRKHGRTLFESLGLNISHDWFRISSPSSDMGEMGHLDGPRDFLPTKRVGEFRRTRTTNSAAL